MTGFEQVFQGRQRTGFARFRRRDVGLVSKGVDCVSRPERSPRGHTFFFARDMDGNLIEMMDLGYMYYVLGWLGPLGGWIFRRGMYKTYYT